MKNAGKYFGIVIFLIIIGIIFYVVINQKEKPLPEDQTGKIEALKKERDQSRALVMDLRNADSLKALQLDSLQLELKDIRDQTQAHAHEIDQDLEEDSTRALQRNREALRNLGIQTALSPQLTFFEMGWNAKFLSENLGMKLQIRKMEEIDRQKDERMGFKEEVIREQHRQLANCDTMTAAATKQIEFFEAKYNRTQNFFYDRIIIYGGAGLNYNGIGVTAGAQIGIGFKIFGFKLSGDDK